MKIAKVSHKNGYYKLEKVAKGLFTGIFYGFIILCLRKHQLQDIMTVVFLSDSLCVSCVVSMCVSVCLMCGEYLSLGSYLVAAIV